ncbi:MAG: glutamine amidotransferase [Deltaproteobacteria bacterium]|nr:glutamine amidotransferase [Deltaproteobacteria bacterium]
MTNPFLILQCGAIPKRYGLGDFAGMFMEAGSLKQSEVTVINVNKYAPPNPASFSAALITGSLAMVTNRAAWSLRLAKWIPKAIESGLPILGVCFGHQIMAQAMGGEVDYNDKGLTIGTFDVHLTPKGQKHPLFSGYSKIFKANMDHSQVVVNPPKCAEILGHSSHDPHQILSYSPKVLSVQYHPEFSRENLEAFLRSLGSNYKAPSGRPQGLIKGQAEETLEARQLIYDFFSLAPKL